MIFAENFEKNILNLHRDLIYGRYAHGDYESFFIHDPKKRNINKAEVGDRILHHAIHRILEPIFDRMFIFDSYSSRKGKGVHKAIDRLQFFASKLSRNNTKTVWIMKCDIRKFFDSVDHKKLMGIIQKKIRDEKTIKLLENIISSYNCKNGKGIPLGNLTSQLFSNIYLNELDHFIKRELKVKYYIRYADDFVILYNDKIYLENLAVKIRILLKEALLLEVHERKLIFSKWHKGVDFLGFVSFQNFKILRTKTKKRILNKLRVKLDLLQDGKISEEKFEETKQSYLGLLSHGRSHKILININKHIKILG